MARRWFSNWLVVGALDRPVARVVHAWRDLVRQELAADVEELHREHADVVEVVDQASGELLTVRLERGVEAGGRGPAQPEDPALVVVLDEWPTGDLAVETADGEHRQLAVEGHQRLEEQRHTAQLGPRAVDVRRVAQHAPGPCRRSRPAGS